MSNKSLTVVLPIYNGESKLRACVGEILELAAELTTRFGVLIIDDGSTDSTYEVAEELAAHYPQVSVMRHRYRRGIGPTVEYVQRRYRSDAVIIHDGVSAIDPNQVRSLWHKCIVQANTGAGDALQSDICDFANLPAIHAAVERVHRRVLGFQFLAPQAQERDPQPIQEFITPARPRTDLPHTNRRAGMGRIPPLPRPKFLSAIAEFALGE